MEETCLYIMCGLPFAGKSTLAGELAQALDAVSIELDAINGERGLGLDGKRIAAEDWDRTYAEAYRRIAYALADGSSVVYDAASFTREQRREVGNIAEKLGLRSRVIYVDVPEHVARERLQQNRETKRRVDVRDDDFVQVVDSFQPPTDDEHVLRYDQTLSAREWVHRYFAALL